MSSRQFRKREARLCVFAGLFTVTLFIKIGSISDRWSTTSHNERDDMELALLTSFWAQRAPAHPHEKEVKGAILANLLNPHLAEIHVVLDGTTHNYGCDDFTAELDSLLKFSTKEYVTQLKCTPWKGEQPTYHDLFKFSKRNDLRDKVVVLSNADMVFDDSIAALRSLDPASMVVIATGGLDKSETPDEIRWYFENFTGLPLNHVVSRCYEDGTPRTSWDAHAFHPDSLELFEKDFIDVRSGKTFHMNRNGAENAALEAVSRHSDLLQFSQICDHVKMWHFHTTSKMHKTENGVKHDQLKPESCVSSVKDCLIPGHIGWTIRDVSELT